MLHSIALTFIPGLSATQQAEILRHVTDAERVITHPREALADVCAAQYAAVCQAIEDGRSAALQRAREEMEFCTRHSVEVIPITSERYPTRLRDCPDAPPVIYYCGTADLNAGHVIAIVGTRHITEYGKQCCRRLTEEMARLLPDTLIVSGLAYGVDIHAHRGAMEQGMPTVAVVAHGLDQIYPASHHNDARRMTARGGIVTEYVRGTAPLQGNFLRRNRIVAGMADAVIVVESASHGGSLVTARIANSYQRSVFAVPGRINDPYSAGCNKLIATQKADAVLTAEDIVRSMGWWEETTAYKAQNQQLTLFDDFAPTAPAADTALSGLTAAQQKIARALQGTDGLSVKSIAERTGLKPGDITSELFDMEMDDVVSILPGDLYRLTK